MVRRRNRVQFDLKEIGLRDVAVPDDVQATIKDLTVLMFHLHQILTEYSAIIERHGHVLGDAEQTVDFADVVAMGTQHVQCLFEDVVAEGMLHRGTQQR